MWILFMISLTLWIFTKFILNVMEIFEKGEEMIAHKQFIKNLHQDLLDQINLNTKEE